DSNENKTPDFDQKKLIDLVY
nr:hypothetical protein [Tanacetum cinerariifolium]